MSDHDISNWFKPWTEEDRQELTKIIPGHTVAEAARILKRTKIGVIHKVRELRMAGYDIAVQRYTNAEKEIIRRMAAEGSTSKEIATALGRRRTVNGVEIYRRRTGLAPGSRHVSDPLIEQNREMIGMWQRGKSAEQIARKTGTNRNVVIGRVYRWRRAGVKDEHGNPLRRGR